MCYVTRSYAKMLENSKHKVFILKQGTNSIEEEFKNINATIIEYPNYIVDANFFKSVLEKYDIDITIFNEYKQWNEDPNELLSLCKELGVKTYGYLVLEKFKSEQAKEYDRILASSRSFEKFMRFNRLRNFTYVPVSLDMQEFPNTERNPNEKFTFFHPGGFGGVHERKNTWAVIEAFELMKNVENCKLVITSQKEFQSPRELHPNIEIINKELDRKELIELYYKSDCTVLPSKWETIGIPILESLASGTPVITTDVPPMNEFVKNCENGYVCSGEMKYYPEIEVMAIDVDIKDLSQKMEMIESNEILYHVLQKNARKDARERFDLEKNKKHFLKLLEKDLK